MMKKEATLLSLAKKFNFWKKKSSSTEEVKLAKRIEEDRLFFEEHTDGIILMNLKGEIYDLNKKTLLLFGYHQSNRGSNYEQFIHHDDVGEVQKHFKDALQGRTVHYSCRIRHAENRFCRIEVTNIPIYQDHMIVGVYGILRDISHIENMRKLLSTLESTSQLTEDAYGVVYLSFSNSGSLLRYSSSISTLLGSTASFKQSDAQSMIDRWVHPNDLIPLRQYINQVKQNKQQVPSIEIRVKHATLGYQDVLCKCAVLYATKNEELTVTCILQNLNELKKMKSELNHQKNQLFQMFHTVRNAVFTVNTETKQVEIFTKEYEALFEIPGSNLEHSYFYWESRIHPEDKLKVLSAYSRLKDDEKKVIEYRYMNGNGRYKWIEERLNIFKDENTSKRKIHVIASDITLIKQQEEKILDLAMTDALSGLPNRLSVIQMMEQWKKEERQFTIVSISFNEVSKINETFGYEVGDQWIDTTSKLLQDIFSHYGILGHLYGDEYLWLIPDISEERDIRQNLQPLLRLSRKKLKVGSYEWYPKITMGVSRYPLDSDESMELLRYANLSLSRIKHLIEGGIEIYSSTESIDSYRNFQLSKHLRSVVENQELFLEFQPKVDAWSGKIIGAEALVRWLHPEWGRIPPGQFIPLSEENETHIAITDWVLEEVCRILSLWKKQGKMIVPISINISPKRLMHGKFDEKIINMIRKYDISPEWLEIEILETDILAENIKIKDALMNIAAHKIQISLDDFGSGYSSISYLHNFPIHTIKIDRQFSIRVDKDKKTRSLIRSILFMAEEFGLQVVAEGVDQVEQLYTLREMKCGVIQGFLFSRPLLLKDLEQKILEGKIHIKDNESREEEYSNSTNAEVTISYFRNQKVQIGHAPILIVLSDFQQVTFISAIRLPMMDDIELSIYLPSNLHQTDIRVFPKSVMDLDNGLIKYVATYKNRTDSKIIEQLLLDNSKKTAGY